MTDSVVISIPAWGERASRLAEKWAIPSLLASLDSAGVDDAHFVIHTDRQHEIIQALAQGRYGFSIRDVPMATDTPTHERFSACHREVIADAPSGSIVVPFCADMLVSIEAFSAVLAAIGAGKKLIMVGSNRTQEGEPPLTPVMSSRVMLAHVVENLHWSIKECFWGHGRTQLPSTVLFKSGENVVMRGFHLHPLAFVKSDGISFGGTVDHDLICNFDDSEIHVVTNPGEMAVMEMSPPSRGQPMSRFVMSPESVALWATTVALAPHRRLFRHRIVLRGDEAKVADRSVASRIYEVLGDLESAKAVLQ